MDASACVDCPKGSYCPSGAIFPIWCPPGLYNNVLNSIDMGACYPCSAGYYCPEYGSVDSHGQTATTLIDYICPEGFYCLDGTHLKNLYPCPAGTYNDITGIQAYTSCKLCPNGFLCDIGTTSDLGDNPPIKCMPGYNCPLAGPGGAALLITKCSAGSYSQDDSGVCLPCPSGSYCLEGASFPTAICNRGFYCPSPTNSPVQYPCPAGKYGPNSEQIQSNDCLNCPLNYYCPIATINPIPCPAGTKRTSLNGASISDCISCSNGNYCPDGTGEIPCGTGQYSYDTQRPCLPCPVGYYCDTATISISDLPSKICPAGYYCPQSTNANPTSFPAIYSCPAGYYCPQGVYRPLPCPAGSPRLTTGAAALSDCNSIFSKVWYDRAETSSTGTGPCKEGYYCPQGSFVTNYMPCPATKYTMKTDLDASIQCDICPPGYYCPLATSLLFLCPQGPLN